jgi:hypothetical protein
MILFYDSGVWTQGFVLYCLSHTSSSFCSVILEITDKMDAHFAQVSLDRDSSILCFLPSLGWWQLFSVVMRSGQLFFFFFALAGLERTIFPCSLHDKHAPLRSSIGQDRVSLTFCPGCGWTTILSISTFQVAMITGTSHWHLAPFPL